MSEIINSFQHCVPIIKMQEAFLGEKNRHFAPPESVLTPELVFNDTIIQVTKVSLAPFILSLNLPSRI